MYFYLNLIINGCLKFFFFQNKDLMNRYKVADKSPEQAWRDALNKNRTWRYKQSQKNKQ